MHEIKIILNALHDQFLLFSFLSFIQPLLKPQFQWIETNILNLFY